MELQKLKKDILSLTKEQTEIAKELIHFNQLTPYPYSDLQISQWVKSITELIPEMTPEIIKHIIDRLKLGVYEYDSRLGIQNVFAGFRKYLEERRLMYYSIMPEGEELKKRNDKIEKINNQLEFLNSGKIKKSQLPNAIV